MATTHQTAKTQFVMNGDVRYAYRRFGTQNGTPLLFLIHFRGTMDYWDPLLINHLASTRPVILFDNAGVGQSTGVVPDSIEAMAQHVIDFVALINVKTVDVLGFSMGGYITPLVYLNGPPGLVRKLIVAGAGPSNGEGVSLNPPEADKEVKRLATAPKLGYEDGFDRLFFYPSASSQRAGRAWYDRIHERTESTSGEKRSELVSWGHADGGAGMKAMNAAFAGFRDLSQRHKGSYDRLGKIDIPIFIANGQDDFMVPTSNSFIMQQRVRDGRLKIFPDSGHGFLYQFAEEFADDVAKFLDL